MPSVLDRFLAKIVADPHGCWIWQACTGANGYGQFWVDGRIVKAHRWSYEHFVGPIPDGLELDHMCRVRNCVNPHHLEPVTHTENVRRGEGGKHHRAKTHCPQGHPYDGDNTYVWVNGGRRCRICRRACSRAHYARKRAQAAA